MEGKFRLGLKQRIFNWNMRVAREKFGFTQKALGKLVGLKSATISHYETFRGFPESIIQEKIAEILKVSVESIFPQWIKEFKLKAIPEAIEEKSISLEEMISRKRINPEVLMLGGPEEEFKEFDQILLKEQIKEVLDTLSEREKQIIESRFGLGDNEKTSLREVGRKLGITPERVREIQFKALGKIRKNSRQVRELREFCYSR